MFGTSYVAKSNPVAIKSGQETRIRMAQLLQDSQSRPGTRVTRNPAFHSTAEDGLDDLEDLENRRPTLSTYVPLKERSEYIKARPYFLDKTTMTRLKQILLLAICSGTVPWRFNKRTHQIDKWSPIFEKLWKFQWFFVTIQTFLLTGFQFYSFINRVEHDIKTYREVFMNSVSVYWYVCAVYFNINMYLHKDQVNALIIIVFYFLTVMLLFTIFPQMRQYINTLFKFNHDFIGNEI